MKSRGSSCSSSRVSSAAMPWICAGRRIRSSAPPAELEEPVEALEDQHDPEHQDLAAEALLSRPVPPTPAQCPSAPTSPDAASAAARRARRTPPAALAVRDPLRGRPGRHRVRARPATGAPAASAAARSRLCSSSSLAQRRTSPLRTRGRSPPRTSRSRRPARTTRPFGRRHRRQRTQLRRGVLGLRSDLGDRALSSLDERTDPLEEPGVRSRQQPRARPHRDGAGIGAAPPHRDAMARGLTGQLHEQQRPVEGVGHSHSVTIVTENPRRLHGSRHSPRQRRVQKWDEAIFGCEDGLVYKEVRRCPTLPRGLPRSTIGAESLSFRVRNVTGRFPLAMAAVTRSMCCWWSKGPPRSTIGAESLSFRVRNVTGRFPLAMAAETCSMFQSCTPVTPCAGCGVVPIVHREPQSGREQQAHTSHAQPVRVEVLSSRRLISTGQLRRSFVPASTSGLSTQSSTGSLSPSRGMEVSSRRRLPA